MNPVYIQRGYRRYTPGCAYEVRHVSATQLKVEQKGLDQDAKETWRSDLWGELLMHGMNIDHLQDGQKHERRNQGWVVGRPKLGTQAEDSSK